MNLQFLLFNITRSHSALAQNKKKLLLYNIMELPDNSVPDPEVPQITVLTGNRKPDPS